MSDHTIEISDLRPADILLFSGVEGDWISEAIMYLTESKVSHAGMSYRQYREIIDQVPPTVRVAEAAPAFRGRTIYVNRYDGPERELAPVLDAARGYLNDETPYAWGNLVLLGLLLIYKKFTPGGALRRVMIEIFKKLAAEIITYINQGLHPGKLPMVCSQFVYQCYQDAGAGYRLKIDNGNLVGVSLLGEEGAWSLLDQVIARTRAVDSAERRAYLAGPAVSELGEAPVRSWDELAEALVEALRGEEAGRGEAGVRAAGEALEDELVGAVYQFAEAYHALVSGVPADFGGLAKAVERGGSADALGFLKLEEAYFVTPADLLERCTNAKRVGVIVG
ncbi:hypothetical protein [Endothiovibrio diazotrophicus]